VATVVAAAAVAAAATAAAAVAAADAVTNSVRSFAPRCGDDRAGKATCRPASFAA
jgi:hypothetical protein